MNDLAGPKIAYMGFCGPIDSNTVSRLAGAFNTAVNQQFDGVYLCFSSPGGYVGDGVFIYHHIRSLPIPITIHNTGTVASIATTLFVAAKKRLSCPNFIFMMHPVCVGSGGNMSATPLQSALDAALSDEDRTDRILREHTKIPESVLENRKTKDVYLSASQALEYELVQEIGEFKLPAGNQIFQI